MRYPETFRIISVIGQIFVNIIIIDLCRINLEMIQVKL